MALKCAKCGDVYRSQLYKCPQCGTPNPQRPYGLANPVRCPTCNAVYNKMLDRCPHCDAVTPGHTASGQIMATTGVSYYDGGFWGGLGARLAASLMTVFTLGIAFPWAICYLYRFEAEHTVVDGHRLTFDGRGGQLIGKWIIWLLLSIITLGIYLLYVDVAVKKWHTQHLHFRD